ncbi:MAG: hypothetical protein EOP04_14085 [Proteobacteria bacterium]|nr:MAG: hypothetical protein EOP04_14085 [Pseudomonadota bacterium]
MISPFSDLSKWLLTVCALILASSVSSSFAQPISNEESRSALCQILTKLHQTKGAEVWPGFDPLEVPLVAKFSDGVFGFGDKSELQGWNPVVVQDCMLYQSPKNFNAPSSPLVMYFDVGGAKGFYFDLTIKDEITASLLSAVVHERFHRFQFEHFSQNLDLLHSAFTDHLQTPLVANVYAQNKKLTTYLKSGDVNDLKDFLALRSTLIGKHTGSSELWVTNQARFEGTATYVQLKAMQLIEAKFKWGYTKIWADTLVDDLSLSRGVDGMIKWRHYSVGGALLQFLDSMSLDESWKNTIQVQPLISFHSLVLGKLEMKSTEINRRSLAIRKSIEFKRLELQAGQDIRSYQSEIDVRYQELSSQKFVILVKGPKKIACSGGGFSQRTYYLATGGRLDVGLTHMSQCSEGIPMFKETHRETQILESLVPNGSKFGADAVTWSADGHVNQGMPEKPIQFQSFKLETPTATIELNAPGIVHTVAGELVVEARDSRD